MGNSTTGDGGRKLSLVGRKLYVPQMSHGGSVAFAAAFRSLGFDAHVSPESDHRTLELGGKYTSGEECLPARVTLGDFLKVTEQPGFDPDKTAFFMPTADGPCRFGQYSPYIKKVMRDLGMENVLVFSPSSRDGYEGLGDNVNDLMRTALRGLICADILRKMLHKTRPYERHKGDTDKVHDECLAAVEKILERQDITHPNRIAALVGEMTRCRDRFRKVDCDYSEPRPLIGVVGEIFCRMTPFTNEYTIRKVEEYGGECTLAHIVEWLWYTNLEQQKRIRHRGKTFSMEMVAAKIKNSIQLKDEHALYGPYHDDFVGYEEPDIRDIFKYAENYLPQKGSLGEMMLSAGKTVFHYHQGCDGVIDISPFTCMNGIVTEAVYPKISREQDNMPIRNFFFDGTQSDLDRDVSIFMELARNYRSRKVTTRRMPRYFETAGV